ncbi:exodeoxyribonuclease VII large subunit [Aquibacillus kalidii]|uniref:exodeoxyribonuclease VII large subunit n=1 Tax=Aquibacillus kalidii TaxID=2762597 RepID=UPI001649442F|nr:exodeoxyribonuclease VII large subunit [Aquibacillus kalidii]
MNDKYLTVTALTKYMKRKFELDKHLRNVWLKAEISNFKRHSRGHIYLTLKDDNSRIQAVMFAGNNRLLKFQPENGMSVLVKGEVSIFEPQGQYQLYIQEMEPDGIGSLYLAFEQLKDRLGKEGLFDPSRKLALPKFPKQIGVITSPTGAAVRDILTTIRRRYPIVGVTVIPVLVQGEYAANSIARAISFANQLDKFDLLIVGRGGGSIEELWSFNEEVVAREIARSTVPIISAVGHETDFTISDFVADLRAATPTGAAELAVPSQDELRERIGNLTRSLERTLKTSLTKSKERLEQLAKSYAFRYPEQLVKQKEQELDRNVERLTKSLNNLQTNQSQQWLNIHKRLTQQHPNKQIIQLSQDMSQLVSRMNRAINNSVQVKEKRFSSTIDKLTLLNPLNTMKRGYSISYSKDGKVIQSTKQIQLGDQVSIKVLDGTLDCQVSGIEEDKKDE